MADTSVDEIPKIFQDLRQTFNTGKTKSLTWRRQQLEQLLKMFEEQSDLFASAVNADFHRPSFETKFLDCGSVGRLKYLPLIDWFSHSI